MREDTVRGIVAVLCLVLAAVSAEALELQAGAVVEGCYGWARVLPNYVPPIIDGAPVPDPCIVPSIPSNSTSLRWLATELWEMPPQTPQSYGWTKLTCGAVYDNEARGWSFSCFHSGVLGQYNGHTVAGLHTGTAAQLDALVRAWWGSQH